MPKNPQTPKRAIRVVRHRLACDSIWPSSERKHCKQRMPETGNLPAFTTSMVQDVEISILRMELIQQRNLVEMLLALVDPEDVKAAIQLRQITPPTCVLLDIAKDIQPPDDVDDELERPW